MKIRGETMKRPRVARWIAFGQSGVVLAGLALTSCSQFSSHDSASSQAFVEEDVEVVAIERYVLIEPDGRLTTYLDAIGGQRNLPLDAEGLPIYPVNVSDLSDDLEWVEDYDSNGDGIIAPSEFTHAWMVRAAERVTLKFYSADSLAYFPRVAQISRGIPDPLPAAGTTLSDADQRLVRRVLDVPDQDQVGTDPDPVVEAALDLRARLDASLRSAGLGAGSAATGYDDTYRGGSDGGGGDGGGGGGGDAGAGGGSGGAGGSDGGDDGGDDGGPW
ncbi:MAG: hypothetical protein QNJ30_07620 [Kiloniellales bacterium]|nr:hypothetical protein [Kiloniellales bacterium]